MPKMTTTYDLLISCPADIEEERLIIKDVVDNFNRLYGAEKNIQICVRHWSTDAYPESGGKPQDLVNKQFINNCDAAIAIFWTRFGTPTDKYQSGSEEEIEEMIKSGKQVFLYFCERPINPSDFNEKQYKKVKSFKAKYKDRGIYYEYSDLSEFNKLLLNHISKHFLNVSIDELPEDEIKKMLVNLYEKKYSAKTSNNKSYRGENDISLKSLAENISLFNINQLKGCIFDSSFNRNMNITLYDDNIEVYTTTIIDRMNPAKERSCFTHNPMFRKESIEFNTYKLIQLMYNDIDFAKDENVVQYNSEAREAYQNNKYLSGKKIQIDISNSEKNNIKIVTKYNTIYSLFFQTYYLQVPCENFSFSASLKDNRTKKEGTFVIRWEFFCSSNEKRRIARKSMHQEDDNVIVMNPVKWVLPGDGYIITLNEIKYNNL